MVDVDDSLDILVVVERYIMVAGMSCVVDMDGRIVDYRSSCSFGVGILGGMDVGRGLCLLTGVNFAVWSIFIFVVCEDGLPIEVRYLMLNGGSGCEYVHAG